MAATSEVFYKMEQPLNFNHPLRHQCSKFLTRHKPFSQRMWLESVLSMPEVDYSIDCFGSGPALEALERTMADLLGKEKAVFVHKGMMGQLSVLKHYAELSGFNKIALHSCSHIEQDEGLAYKKVMGLVPHFYGSKASPFTALDITALPSDLAAVSVELPTRHAGFLLPSWSCLVQLKQHCREHGHFIHIDGARLLESAAYWNKDYSEVAAIGDSVYVSLYKTLGGMAGGIIAGDSELIESILPWKTRLAGDIYTVFPYVLSALQGIKEHLPNIPIYCQRAKALATALSKHFGRHVIPYPVQTNAFIFEFLESKECVEKASIRYAKKHNVWLFDRVIHDNFGCRVEIQIGNAMNEWSDEQVIDAFEEIIFLARSYRLNCNSLVTAGNPIV